VKFLDVKLPNHNYPIIWNNDFSSLAKLIKEKTANGKHFLITNNTLFNIYENEIHQIFGNCHILTPLEDGESHKNFTTITKLADELLQYGANRKSILWAFGGGVIGDITGFLASIYMRGISFYQIPTTLLSMVDSSVGGKTGVNLLHGKNMIGTFHQPEGVFIHVNFLKTLSEREFRCGLSEVIKSALLVDQNFFAYMEGQIQLINDHISFVKDHEIYFLNYETRNDFKLNESILEELSFRSVQVKANVVIEDEKESGRRAILNLGHTLAHALESFYNYTNIKHGEAVSVGIIFAALLSLKKGLHQKDFQRIKNMIQKLHLIHDFNDLLKINPLLNPKDNLNILIDLMKGDKKNTDESIRFILLQEIGKTMSPEAVDIPIIWKTLKEFTCL